MLTRWPFYLCSVDDIVSAKRRGGEAGGGQPQMDPSAMADMPEMEA